MRQVLLAGEIPHKRPALQRDMVADRALQGWKAFLDRVEKTPDGEGLHVERDLAPRAPQRSQVRREYDSNHASVWTSTESTAGKSCTMGAQLSPESADAYT